MILFSNPGAMAATDFFAVPTVTFCLLYVLIVITDGRPCSAPVLPVYPFNLKPHPGAPHPGQKSEFRVVGLDYFLTLFVVSSHQGIHVFPSSAESSLFLVQVFPSDEIADADFVL
jgi:hypothetical protein